MTYHDEGTVIQEVLASGLPCELKLASYNDALSLRARLTRYIKKMNEIYEGRSNNPFEKLEVVLIKPKTLRFEYAGELQIRPATTP